MTVFGGQLLTLRFKVRGRPPITCPMSERGDERAIALSAGAIYASAMFVGLIEDMIPGGPEFSLLPGFIAMVVTPLVLLFGPKLSRAALAPLGPFGAAVIAYALATTHGYADSAVLYMWPVLWMAHFYGSRGTVFIVAWTGLVHGLAVWSMPGEQGNIDRWIDVMVSVIVVAGVVRGCPRAATGWSSGSFRGAHRPPDRPAQPPRLPGAHGRRALARAARADAGSPPSRSTSTTSSASTTTTGTSSATACSPGSAR